MLAAPVRVLLTAGSQACASTEQESAQIGRESQVAATQATRRAKPRATRALLHGAQRSGLGMSSLAPVPGREPDLQQLHGAAGRRPALLPLMRPAVLAGQAPVPRRAQLRTDAQLAPAPTAAPVAYAPYIEPSAGPAWLRRYAPLFAVASVLLLAMIVGLLVGHWVTQGKSSTGPQVIKVEGLSAAAGTGAAAATTPTTPATTPAAAAASKTNPASSKEEKQEEAEAKAEEAKKVAPPAPVKVSSTTLTKIEKSTGRKHQEELNKIGTAPIAVP